jgi:hypothetical protein
MLYVKGLLGVPSRLLDIVSSSETAGYELRMASGCCILSTSKIAGRDKKWLAPRKELRDSRPELRMTCYEWKRVQR